MYFDMMGDFASKAAPSLRFVFSAPFGTFLRCVGSSGFGSGSNGSKPWKRDVFFVFVLCFFVSRI